MNKATSDHLDDLFAEMDDIWSEVKSMLSQAQDGLSPRTDRQDIEEYSTKALRLAEAVLQFADWQWGGYVEGACPEARRTVGIQLWSEVSDHVYQLTRQRAASPRFDREVHEPRSNRPDRF